MESRAERLGAAKSDASLLVLFIPSVDRDEKPIEHDAWVTLALKVLGTLFGGATAFPQGRGVWRALDGADLDIDQHIFPSRGSGLDAIPKLLAIRQPVHIKVGAKDFVFRSP